MKKQIILILSITLLITNPLLASGNKEKDEYNPEIGKSSMRIILKSMQEITPALKEGNYLIVEEKFIAVKDAFEAMLVMSAPTGSETDWEASNKMAVELSMKAIEAAKAEDSETIQEIVGKLFGMQKEGHKQFKNY